MKKYRFKNVFWSLVIFLSAVDLLRADNSYSNAVMSLSPLAYWQLNGTDMPPSDIATNIGSLGNSANGYYVSGAVHPVGGALANGVGTGVQFPNAAGNRVVIPYQPALGTATPFSVEFWAAPADVSSADSSFMCPASLTQFGAPPGNGDGTRKGWLFYQNGGAGWIFRTYGSANTAFNATANQTITVGQWYHIVGVYDGTNVLLYVNGQLAASTPADSYVPVDAAASPFSVGARGYGALGFFRYNGSMDEVAYYTNILSPADILAHYQNGVNASASASSYAQLVQVDKPLVYLRFDEPAFTAPDPSTYPMATNLGSLGSEANGSYYPGAMAGEPGVPYAGLNGTYNLSAGFSPDEGGYVDMGASESLDFLGTPFSIALWFKTAPTDARFQTFIGKGDASWRAGIDGSGFARFAYGSNPDLVGSKDLNDAQWHQLVGVYDGTNLYMYIDGLLDSSGNGSSQAGGSTSDLLVGTVPDYIADRVFKGSMDEVAIFGSALTGDQVSQLYLAADAPPQISQEPPSTVIADEGTTAKFGAEVFGAGTLTFQWQKDGTNLMGQTSTNLSLSNVHIADSGNYTLVVTSSYGAVTSSVVALTVQAGPPVIVVDPSSVGLYAGKTATFSVTAGGSNPLYYRWQLNGTNLPGQTATNLVLPNLQIKQAGAYTVTITNLEGAVTSSVATLMVEPMPTNSYPVAVLADNPISYWRLDESHGLTAYDFAGGNNGYYTNAMQGVPGYSATDRDTAAKFGPAAPSDVGSIPNIDFGTNGGLPSFSLEAWVKAPPQSSDSCVLTKGTGAGGEQFNMDFGASGGAFRFFVRDASGGAQLCNSSIVPDGQWHHLVGVCDGAAQQLYFYIDGALQNQASITSGILTSHQSMTIGCRQSGTTTYDDQLDGVVDEVAIYGYALSSDQVNNHFNARFTAGSVPVIVTQPMSQTNYVSLSTTFSVDGGGSGYLSYQWLSNSLAVGGANSSSFTVAPLDYSSAANYQVVITGDSGSVTSSVAKLTILAPPTRLDLSAGLVLHLPFDNNYTDTSGYNNNGTNVGATTFVPGAIGSGALHYYTDTSSSSYNYVSLGYKPILNFSSNVNFSVAYWVRLPAGASPGDLPFICNAAGSTFSSGYTFAPSYQDGGWAWSLNGTGVYGVNDSINDGNWHHLVHTFDRSGYGITYLDGVQVDSHAVANVGSIDQAAQTCIGQDPTGKYGETGEADIDDVGMWRRVLSPLEAASIFVAGESNAVSFASASAVIPTLGIAPLGAQLQITWTGSGTLQGAGDVTGTYTNIPGATSPYLVTPSGSQLFFRLSIP